MGHLCSCGAALLLLTLTTSAEGQDAPCPYSWKTACDSETALAERIPEPPGYEREPVDSGTFAAWLRRLPLLPGRPPVRLHDGRLKLNQKAHAAVVDIDVGRRDLQQCADAVMRLRAEYLFAVGREAKIGFRFTSGDACPFSRWARGERPVVRGSRVTWARPAGPDVSHASLRRYLDVVFTYAGSASLERELAPLGPGEELRAGDVFIQGGFPGHAVLIVDTARRLSDGARAFLLVQSYMPAQQIHLLRNPGSATLGPWYAVDFGETLQTPEWGFSRTDLRRFRD
jgi:hypothetical protein